MSEQLQLRSGSFSQVSGFTPVSAECVVDTTYNRLCVGDGSTAGGWPAAIEKRSPVADAAYSVLATDRIVAYTSITAARIVTLPAAANYPTGARLAVVDESGSCSTTNTITLNRAGSDTIDGQTSVVVNSAYGYVGLESNGSNAWTVINSGATVARSPHGAFTEFQVIEVSQTFSSGSSVTLTNAIPGNCVVFAVSARVTAAITTTGSPTGINIGDQTGMGDGAASATRFGSNVGLSLGTTNYGLPGNQIPNYSATSIIIALQGGSSPAFTGGSIRLAIHLMMFSPPAS